MTSKYENESLNQPDESSFFLMGNSRNSPLVNTVWHSVDEVLPACVVESNLLRNTLSLNGLWQIEDENDKSYNIASPFVSKLILTFGRNSREPFGANYEIGFYDGERFRQLSGYSIYPDPTHWTFLPQPPA